MFQSIPMLAPAHGFSARWQERRAAQLSKHHQRQSWIFLAVTGSSAAVLLAVLGLSTLSLVIQPEQILIYSLYRLIELLINLETVGDLLSTMLTALGSGVPFIVWIGLSGLASMFSVIWYVLFRQLMTQRRLIQ
jgi:hypothetical protein